MITIKSSFDHGTDRSICGGADASTSCSHISKHDRDDNGVDDASGSRRSCGLSGDLDHCSYSSSGVSGTHFAAFGMMLSGVHDVRHT